MRSPRKRPRPLLPVHSRAHAHAGRGPRDNWRPLTLHWRRPVRLAHVTRISSHVQHLHQSFHAQLQLHMQQLLSRPHRGAGVREALPGARMAGLTRRMPELRRQSLPDRIPLRRDTAHIRRETPATAGHAPPRAPAVAKRALMESRHRTPAPPSMPSVFAIASVARRAAVAAFRRLPSISREPHHLRHASPRPAQVRSAPAERRAQFTSALVWSGSAETRTHAGGADSLRTLQPESEPVSASPARALSQASAAAAQASQVQQAARELQRALLLDPALTDRLTDDVLRKVDKRLRIERERRGL